MLEIKELHILRDIAEDIWSADINTTLADVTNEGSNREQEVLSIRWVDESLQQTEEFINFLTLPNTDHVNMENM